MTKKALFLDRDGVINVDKGYVYKWEDFEFIPEIFDIIKMAKERDYLVIVLTNQSGIARDMYKDEDVHILHNKINQALSEKDLQIDDFFYCANFDENYRKPAPGMLIDAVSRYDIDLDQSMMVGDKPSDILNLKSLGRSNIKTFIIKGNYSIDTSLESLENVYICENHTQLKTYLNKTL